MDQEEASQAAQAAADADRLLDGEDPRTASGDDVRHWLRVYGDLVLFKHDVIRITEEHVARMAGAAAREVEQTDLVVLRQEAERLERRLDFWAGRAAALDGGGAG